MTFTRKQKYQLLFLVSWILAFVIYAELFNKPKFKKLTKSYILSVAFCYDYNPGTWYKNNPPSVIYRYSVNGNTYVGDTQAPNISPSVVKSKLVNKSFPVAIDKNDFSNSRILISPDDYKEIHLNFPDSLQWVLKLVEK